MTDFVSSRISMVYFWKTTKKKSRKLQQLSLFYDKTNSFYYYFDNNLMPNPVDIFKFIVRFKWGCNDWTIDSEHKAK